METLLAVIRPAGSPDGAGSALSGEPDWTALVRLALAHGVAGLLAAHLLEAAPDLLAEELAVALKTYLAHCQSQAEAAQAELLALLDALDAAGVRALPFKGPALAQLAHDAPALRGCRDLDLLIDEADIGATMAVLHRLGFRSQYPDLRPTQRRAYHRYNGQDILSAPDRLPVEPHWALAPRSLAAGLDTRALFARARPLALGGCQVATLCPEDALLVAGLHGSKEEWARLVWVLDVAGLLRRHPALDGAAVLARAAACGVHRMVLVGVALAVQLFGAPCPGVLAAALAADAPARRLAEVAAGRLRQGCAEAPSVFHLTAFRWSIRERWQDRLRYLTGTLLTARVKHYQLIDLPDWLHGLYPMVRLGHDFVALPLWRLARRGGDGR